MRLDKVVLMIGALSGIRAAIARDMASAGAKVMLGARRVDRLAALTGVAMLSMPVGATEMTSNDGAADHPYVGLWVTEDNRVRHRLLPNGRYVEARGSREAAYEGRYEVTGDHIEYWDDTGFTADGDFVDGVLHHAGMILRRAD
jgi:NAD(P)-dependent dehydrogenase (short-subunit alcohol dehydrogenase family)